MTIKIGSLFAPDTSAHKSPANEQPPNINPSFQTTNLQSLDHLSARISASSFDRNNPVRQTEADATQTFKTNGGSWRIRNTVENDTPRFYRNGADTSKTTRFDKEFYTDKNTGKWIHLNSSGRLADLPEYKDKAKPEAVSEFDWQGWREVSAADVPGEYTSDGKTVEFGNPANADDAGILLRRYVQQNVIGEGWTGDTTTDGWAAIRARELGVKVEAEAVGTNEKGDTVFRVKVSEADLAKLRQVKAEWTAKKAEQAQNNAAARNETNEQFLDLGRELWNSGVNIAEGAVNTALDAAQTNGGTNPLPLMNPNRPQADFSSAKTDYRSEMMRRDLNGKLDGKGIKAGQAIETVVTIAAPIVVGAAITPKAAPQSLKTLGGIPEVEATGVGATQASQTTGKTQTVESVNAASSIPKATADVRKFSEYIFTPNSKGKDVVFRNMGYTEKDSAMLAEMWKKQAAEKFGRGEYTLGIKNEYGQRINIEITLKGIGEAKEKVSYLKSGWMINNDGTIKLTTPFSGFTKSR